MKRFLALALLVLSPVASFGATSQLNALAFGVLADGSDQTANMQTAVNAAVSVGWPLLVPPGIVYNYALLTNVADCLLDDQTTIGRQTYRGSLTVVPGAAGRTNSVSDLYSFGALTVTNNIIDVRSFGAIGDGSTDDTTAIKLAIGYITTNMAGGVIVFPAGVYRTVETITVPAGIVLQGAGFIGATSLTPPILARGTMIRYEGTTGEAIAVTKGDGSYLYRVEIRDMRVGAAGQSPAPDGIRIENGSECKLVNVQINGGFRYGLVLKDVTLSKFDNIHAAANETALYVANSATGGYLQDCLFTGLNFFQHASNAVWIAGSVRNVLFNDKCWFEYQKNGILISPEATLNAMAVDNLVFENSTISVGDAITYPQSRSLLIEGGVTNGIVIKGIRMRNNLFYNNQADYALEVKMTNNTSVLSTAYNISVEDCNAYGIQQEMLTNDWQNASLAFRGALWTFDGFAAGTQKLPFNTNMLGKISKQLDQFDYVDKTESQIETLPTRTPNTFQRSMWGWSVAQNRPYWHDGTNVVYLPNAQSDGSLDVKGGQEIYFHTGHILSAFSNNLYLSGVAQNAFTILDDSSRPFTLQIDGSGNGAVVAGTGKTLTLSPNAGAGSGTVNLNGTLHTLLSAGTAIIDGSGNLDSSGASPFTINPTDLYLPVRSNATTMLNSPIHIPSGGGTNIIVDGQILFGSGQTNVIYRDPSDYLIYTNKVAAVAVTAVNGTGDSVSMTAASGLGSVQTTETQLNITANSKSAALFSATSIFSPTTSAGLSLGSSALPWDKSFLASYTEISEIADPGGGGANTGRLYVRDNGAGKSQLVIVFNTGAVQVIATEP